MFGHSLACWKLSAIPSAEFARDAAMSFPLLRAGAQQFCGLCRIVNRIERNDHRIVPAQHAGRQPSQIDARVGNYSRSTSAVTGLVRSFDAQRRNVGRLCQPCAGSRPGPLGARDRPEENDAFSVKVRLSASQHELQIDSCISDRPKSGGEAANLIVNLARPYVQLAHLVRHAAPQPRTVSG